MSICCREIGRMDTKELSRDTSATRTYAAFLLELARCVPAVMLPSISVLLVLLDGEVSTSFSDCAAVLLNVDISENNLLNVRWHMFPEFIFAYLFIFTDTDVIMTHHHLVARSKSIAVSMMCRQEGRSVARRNAE